MSPIPNKLILPEILPEGKDFIVIKFPEHPLAEFNQWESSWNKPIAFTLYRKEALYMIELSFRHAQETIDAFSNLHKDVETGTLCMLARGKVKAAFRILCGGTYPRIGVSNRQTYCACYSFWARHTPNAWNIAKMWELENKLVHLTPDECLQAMASLRGAKRFASDLKHLQRMGKIGSGFGSDH